MKKLVSLIIIAAMCLAFTACGGGGESSQNNGNAATELVLGEKYSIEEFADITLVSIEATKKVTAAMGDGLYYESDNDDQRYIDVIFDLTNTSSEGISSEDIMTATATSSEGVEYTCNLYAIEKEDFTWVSNYETINPLSNVRFHAAISVPVSENEFLLQFKLKNSKFSYDFSADKTVKNTIDFKIGDVIGNDDYAEVEFVGTEFKDRIDPTDTSRAYSYVEVESPDNTYMTIELNVTNYQSIEKDIDTFVGAKAVFMGKYKYTGKIVSEDSDQRGISYYNDIAPLETARVFVLIEVPKTLINEECTVELFFNKAYYKLDI